MTVLFIACSYVEGPMQPVYRVVFTQKDLWEGYEGTDEDQLEIEVSQKPCHQPHTLSSAAGKAANANPPN